MNILILNWRDSSHPKAGGAEQVTMEHAKGWTRKGHTVTWLTSHYRGAKKNEIIDGVNITRRGGSLSVYLHVPIYLLLHAKKFDVIVDEIHGIPFFAPLFTRTPVVVFIHEIAGEIWDFMYPFPVNILGRTLEQYYFHLYKKNIFWTDAKSTAEEIKLHDISAGHIYAIPCPIRLPAGYPSRVHKKETNPTFIFVSRVVKMKGIEEVIKAFSFIKQTLTDAKLWIVGSGEQSYVASLKRMLVEYKVDRDVMFWGKVTDEKKLELVGRAHLLLHASVKEGWGLVVLEAASQMTPTIAYNVNGLRDVVRHQKTGIVLSQNSPREMAQQAIRLYTDSQQYVHFQKQGKDWVNSLTWEDAIKQSEALLVKAMHSHS